ncbi:MAG: 4Fe-4S binding protein [Ignavibacteriaceae bacterium]|nr:4Fe-4S binding protein [Ignavibacteriaceae bacterium]
MTTDTGYVTITDDCIVCDACITECPLGAITNENGKVIVETTKCVLWTCCANVINNAPCVSVCPVSAIVKG